jgi:hypothetical protein
VQLVEISTEWHSAEKQTAADQLHGHLRLPSVPCEAMKLAFSFWCLKGTCQNLVSWYLMKHATGIFSWSTPTSTPKHRVCACRDKIPPWRDRVMDQSMSWQYYSFGKTQTHVATKTHMRRSKPFFGKSSSIVSTARQNHTRWSTRHHPSHDRIPPKKQSERKIRAAKWKTTSLRWQDHKWETKWETNFYTHDKILQQETKWETGWKEMFGCIDISFYWYCSHVSPT